MSFRVIGILGDRDNAFNFLGIKTLDRLELNGGNLFLESEQDPVTPGLPSPSIEMQSAGTILIVVEDVYGGEREAELTIDQRGHDANVVIGHSGSVGPGVGGGQVIIAGPNFDGADDNYPAGTARIVFEGTENNVTIHKLGGEFTITSENGNGEIRISQADNVAETVWDTDGIVNIVNKYLVQALNDIDGSQMNIEVRDNRIQLVLKDSDLNVVSGIVIDSGGVQVINPGATGTFTLAGTVDGATGGLNSGFGFTVVRNSAGSYTVTLDAAYQGALPFVYYGLATDGLFASTPSKSTTGFDVSITDGTTPTDSDFDVLIVTNPAT